jgi:hypothetical protein
VCVQRLLARRGSTTTDHHTQQLALAIMRDAIVVCRN